MTALRLDATDRRLLDLLQRDNSRTNLELASAAGISPPTCLRRVRELREAGVIAADVCLLDPDKIGGHLILIVEVELAAEDRDRLDTFEARIRERPEVKQCYRVAGEVDYLLVLHVSDMRAFDRFMREVLHADKSVRRFRTLTTINRVKFDTTVQLQDEQDPERPVASKPGRKGRKAKPPQAAPASDAPSITAASQTESQAASQGAAPKVVRQAPYQPSWLGPYAMWPTRTGGGRK